MIKDYINKIKDNKQKLIELKKTVSHYQLLGNQFGQNFLNEAILEVKKEKNKDTLNDLEVF